VIENRALDGPGHPIAAAWDDHQEDRQADAMKRTPCSAPRGWLRITLDCVAEAFSATMRRLGTARPPGREPRRGHFDRGPE
jgi:hypothetical protein